MAIQKQQINFYLSEFRPVRQWMNASHAIGCTVIFLVLLMAYSVWSYWQYHRLAERVEHAAQNVAALEVQINDIQAQRPQTNLLDIEAEVAREADAFERKEALLAVLGGADLGNNLGFSAQLIALGTHSSTSISLTGFSLKQGGRFIDLAGHALSTRVVTQYVEKLQADDAFASTGFGVIRAEPTNAASTLKRVRPVFQFIVAPTDDNADLNLSPIRWGDQGSLPGGRVNE